MGGGLYLSTIDYLLHSVVYGLEVVITVVGAVAAALVWSRRRPVSAIAPLLRAFAFATAIVSLQGSSDELRLH